MQVANHVNARRLGNGLSGLSGNGLSSLSGNGLSGLSGNGLSARRSLEVTREKI